MKPEQRMAAALVEQAIGIIADGPRKKYPHLDDEQLGAAIKGAGDKREADRMRRERDFREQYEKAVQWLEDPRRAAFWFEVAGVDYAAAAERIHPDAAPPEKPAVWQKQDDEAAQAMEWYQQEKERREAAKEPT